MGTVGDAYDNARTESFVASLEHELLARRSFKSKAEAKTTLFTYIASKLGTTSGGATRGSTIRHR